MKRYIKYINTYKWLYLVILFFAGVASLCGLIRTYYLSVVIDDVLGMRNIHILKDIIILLVLIFGLEQTISYIVGYINTYVSQQIAFDLREKLICKFRNMSLKSIQRRMSSDFVVNITDDVNVVSNVLCNYIVTLLSALFSMVITISFILYLNVKLAIVSFVVITIQVVVSFFLSRMTKKNQSDILINNSVHMGIVRQFVNQIKFIRAYHTEEIMTKKYNECSKRIVRLNFISYIISYVYGNINALLNLMGSLIIFIIGVVAVYNGQISIGILFVFDSLTGILSGSISNIVNVVIACTRASVSVGRLNAVFSVDEESEGGENLVNAIESIEFRNVDFAYDDNGVLSGFTCKFEKGRTYAIIGQSGVGKSSLFSLILKFYAQSAGEIRINGQRIEEIANDILRDKITVVFQEACIIDGTSIRDNIVFGREVSQERFDEIVKACNIDTFVNDLPNGYDTIINENGTNLSGGEKQRIYIARALLRDTDVYLFDEAFSHMDKVLESNMMSYIRKRLSDKLIILVSHNIEVIRDIENIILFENNGTTTVGNDTFLKSTSKTYQDFLQGDDL